MLRIIAANAKGGGTHPRRLTLLVHTKFFRFIELGCIKHLNSRAFSEYETLFLLQHTMPQDSFSVGPSAAASHMKSNRLFARYTDQGEKRLFLNCYCAQCPWKGCAVVFAMAIYVYNCNYYYYLEMIYHPAKY